MRSQCNCVCVFAMLLYVQWACYHILKIEVNLKSWASKPGLQCDKGSIARAQWHNRGTLVTTMNAQPLPKEYTACTATGGTSHDYTFWWRSWNWDCLRSHVIPESRAPSSVSTAQDNHGSMIWKWSREHLDVFIDGSWSLGRWKQDPEHSQHLISIIVTLLHHTHSGDPAKNVFQLHSVDAIPKGGGEESDTPAISVLSNAPLRSARRWGCSLRQRSLFIGCFQKEEEEDHLLQVSGTYRSWPSGMVQKASHLLQPENF